MEKTSNKNKKNILLSNSAINQFKKILINEDKNSFVRLLVDSGGCSGFSYKFSVDKSIDDLNDIIILGLYRSVSLKINFNFSIFNFPVRIMNQFHIFQVPLKKIINLIIYSFRFRLLL